MAVLLPNSFEQIKRHDRVRFRVEIGNKVSDGLGTVAAVMPYLGGKGGGRLLLELRDGAIHRDHCHAGNSNEIMVDYERHVVKGDAPEHVTGTGVAEVSGLSDVPHSMRRVSKGEEVLFRRVDDNATSCGRGRIVSIANLAGRFMVECIEGSVHPSHVADGPNRVWVRRGELWTDEENNPPSDVFAHLRGDGSGCSCDPLENFGELQASDVVAVPMTAGDIQELVRGQLRALVDVQVDEPELQVMLADAITHLAGLNYRMAQWRACPRMEVSARDAWKNPTPCR